MEPGSTTPKKRPSFRTRPLIVEPKSPMTKPQKPESGYRVLVDIEVFVQTELGYRGIVTEASVDGNVIIVSMLEGKFAGSEIRVKGTDIAPRQPDQEHAQKQGLVKLLDGPMKERIGWLNGISREADGSILACVKLSTGEVGIFELDLVAIAHAPRKIRSVLP